MQDIDYAKQVFASGSFAFVIVKDGTVIAAGTRDGIGELLDAVERHSSALADASLADKIVGKAVALIAAYCGITTIYTPLASEAALGVCRAHGITLVSDRLVPLIRNKRNDGPCPMEQLTQPLDTPAEAVAALATFVAQRRQPA